MKTRTWDTACTLLKCALLAISGCLVAGICVGAFFAMCILIGRAVWMIF